jgi:5-methylcytosine-specific restriction protein A
MEREQETEERPARTFPKSRDHLFDERNAARKRGYCMMCGRKLPFRKRKYCSDRCHDAAWGLLWKNIRLRHLKAAKWACSQCGNNAWEVHHIIPMFLGGTSLDENLEVLCYDCHIDRHRVLSHEMTAKRRRSNHTDWAERMKRQNHSIMDFIVP